MSRKKGVYLGGSTLLKPKNWYDWVNKKNGRMRRRIKHMNTLSRKRKEALEKFDYTPILIKKDDMRPTNENGSI